MFGPDHLKLAFLPLSDRARCADVFTPAEADVSQDGFVGVVGHKVAYGLAVQAGLFHRAGQDFQTRPGRAAGPAVGLFAAEFFGVGVEVGFGGRAGFAIPEEWTTPKNNNYFESGFKKETEELKPWEFYVVFDFQNFFGSTDKRKGNPVNIISQAKVKIFPVFFGY